MAKQTKLAKKIETLHKLLGKIETGLANIGQLWFDAGSMLVELFNDPEYRDKLGDVTEHEIGDTLDAELPPFTPCNFWQFRDILSHFPNRDTWATVSVAELYDEMLRAKATPDPDAPVRTRKSVTVAQYEQVEREKESLGSQLSTAKKEVSQYKDYKTMYETAVRDNEQLRAENAELRQQILAITSEPIAV